MSKSSALGKQENTQHMLAEILFVNEHVTAKPYIYLGPGSQVHYRFKSTSVFYLRVVHHHTMLRDGIQHLMVWIAVDLI